MMRLVTFTTLYPHAEKPSHGIFVETRLRHLLATGAIKSRVVAPVPWFPFSGRHFGRYGQFARMAHAERRHGIRVVRPRFVSLPKVGMAAAPGLLAAGAVRAMGDILDDVGFDLIDAHYFYPDGVAAALLARYFNKPFVVTARGSDISLVPQNRLARRQILWAARRASGIVAVCRALRDEMVALGIAPESITTLRNGVDLTLFRPADRERTRSALGLTGFTLLAVGNLVPVKGHELMLAALRELPDVQLLVAGSGPLRLPLERLAAGLGVAGRVRFLGGLPQYALREYYCAADALLLASSREGWANVLLEAMACGTPAIAPAVWGIPEVVACRDAGILYQDRTPTALAQAVGALRASPPERAATRRYAEQFSWDETTHGQLRLFRTIAGEPCQEAA